MAGERNRRCFWWTLRALGWTGSCFLKCLLSLSRVWPKGCSDIHLWHLCMVQWASSTPLGSDRVWAMLFCGFPPPAEVTYWALQKSVNATFHDLNNTKKSVPNMYWNELWQKMHDLVMWSIDSCQLSSTPHSKTIRQHMPPSVRHINSALISECICLWPNIYTLLSNQSSQNHLANQCGIINVCVAP